MIWKRRIIFYLTFFILTIALAGADKLLTPVADYSTPKGAALAQKYSSNLVSAVDEIVKVFKPGTIRPLSVDESVVGGAGFWKNPAKFGQDARYMGVLFIVEKPAYIFGDDRNGHVASVLDKYGKTMIEVLTKHIEKMNDSQVDGVAICIIWGDTVNGNPVKVGKEGMALFITASDLLLYKSFKLTIQNLVNRNDLFLFNGEQELDNLTQFILES